jgi:hypothetical protein
MPQPVNLAHQGNTVRVRADAIKFDFIEGDRIARAAGISADISLNAPPEKNSYAGSIQVTNQAQYPSVCFDEQWRATTLTREVWCDGSDSSVVPGDKWWIYLLRISELREVRRTCAGHAGHLAGLFSGRNQPLPLSESEGSRAG